MEVRSSGQEQIQFAGELDVSIDKRGVMVGMKCFNRVQARVGKRADAGLEAERPRMRKRRQAPGVMNDVDDGFCRGAGTRNEPRAPAPEPAIEGFPCVGDMPCVDHRARDLGTSDRATAFTPGLSYQRRDVDRYTKFGEQCADRLNPRDPRLALRRKERVQRPIPRIEEIAEEVKVPAVFDGRDFNPAHRLDAVRTRGCLDFSQRRGRVVIGDRHDRETRL